jgi:class 3 adenylate cyclase
MGLREDLEGEVTTIFRTGWSVREGQKVPEPEEIKLGNDAVTLDAAVLYADLAESTDLVDNHHAWYSAQIYKSYLHCATKLIGYCGGVVTSFDGDRVMGVFIGDNKEDIATRCAMRINYVVSEIINPSLNRHYPNDKYQIEQVVGVDTSKLFAARTGIRKNNDLVWVGRAANYAAKLTTLSKTYPIYITSDVYDRLDHATQYHNGSAVWTQEYWSDRKILVYRTSYWWTF